MAKSETNPHLLDTGSTLETLIFQVARRYGEMNPGTIDGDLALMFIEFANEVVEDVRAHAYHDGSDIDYFTSLQDVRPIPDIVMVSGMLAYFAAQQESPRAQSLVPMYYRRMNTTLWNRLNGNTPIQMRIVDDGTSPRNSLGVTTNKTNGRTS